MCSIKTPKQQQYSAPVTVNAPEPEKAPERIEDKLNKDPDKLKKKVKARGTMALRTDLSVPQRSKTSGLSIPR